MRQVVCVRMEATYQKKEHSEAATSECCRTNTGTATHGNGTRNHSVSR